MSAMPKIGESLKPGSTLEEQTRSFKSGDRCRACRRSPYPRGFEPHRHLCWFCCFPRKETP